MRKVLVTGGTGVIGSILVKELIADGHQVIFTCRDKSQGKEFIERNNLPTKKCFIEEIDFNKIENINDWTQNLPIQIEAVVHNARSLYYLKPDNNGRLSANQIQQEYFMAVTFPYLLNYALLDTKHPLVDIVFISSMYGVVAPNPALYDDFHTQSPLNYGVAKAAQIHLVKELAIRLAEKKIRVNCISYGGIKGRVNDTFIAKYNKLNPMGRMLEKSDLFPPIQFILNNPNLSMTGENIKVDGGWTIW